MSYTKHIAGEYSNLKQMCVICGIEICNHEHTMYMRADGPPPSWPEGNVYISDSKNPTIFLTTEPDGEVIVDCKS